MEKAIIGSIIARSQEELNKRIDKVKDHTSFLQLDIMDGLFVPNHSLDFDFELPPGCRYEAHLMVNDPEMWILRNCNNVDTILVHFESTKDPQRIIGLVRDKGRRFGFAINPETPLDKIKNHLNKIEQLLVMTVNPGFYGSEFLPETLNKVKEARELRPDLDIEVDGGIDAGTIRMASESGANMFVSGSYLMNSDNVKEAVQRLKDQWGGN